MKLNSNLLLRIKRKLWNLFNKYYYNIFSSYKRKRINAKKIKFLQGSNNPSDKLITNLLAHNFKIFHDAYYNYSYFSEALGFCDIKYENKCNNFKSYEEILKNNINKANIQSSLKIWNIVKEINLKYEAIDWASDKKSGYRWDTKEYFIDIKYSLKENKKGVDIKIPWEISRFQHLIFFLQANKKEEIISQILDFISSQPPYFGPNWKTSMDIAIRAVNWIIVINQLYIEKEILDIINSSLQQHLDFIVKNLENNMKTPNNHYLANISGLYIISYYLNNKKYMKFSKQELQKEIKRQFYTDGTNFEGSVYYHRLSTELVFYPLYFSVVNNSKFNGYNYLEIAELEFGKEYVQIMYKIFESYIYLLKPNGQLPQIGDNDSGQYIKLTDRNILDCRYLLQLGTVFFNEERFKIKEFFISSELSEIEILFGNKGLEIWNNINYTELKEVKSYFFKDSGWFILRDNLNYCIVSAGKKGQENNGGHDHNDRLSYELVVNGKDIVVDRGTFVYTSFPEYRNKFRSFKSHNLPFNLFYLIDEEKYFKNLFKNDLEYNIILNYFYDEEDKILLDLTCHYIKENIKHNRKFIWNKLDKTLYIEDFINDEKDIKNILYVVNDIEISDKIEEKEVFISPEYGVSKKAKRIIVNSNKYKVSVK